MPATTRGSSSREKVDSTETVTIESNMADKKKEPSLTEVFGEIKRGNKKTEKSLAELEQKLDRNQKELKEYIKAKDDLVRGLRSDLTNVTTRLTTTESTVKDMERRLSTLSDELEETRKQCKGQDEMISKLNASEKERYEEKKRSNLIIDGIPESRDEHVISTVKQMLADIGVNLQSIQVVTAFRVGPTTKVNKARPRSILLKLASPSMKHEIYKSVKNLRESDKWKKTYISDDLPREQAEQRKILRCLAATARDRGHRAMVRGAALVVDDIRYSYQDIEDLLEGITMENAKMVEVSDGIAFQSHHAFLSSMFPIPIKIRDTPRHCAEQAYWLELAWLAKNKRAIEKIRDSKNGYEAKRAGSLIKMTPELEAKKEEVMGDVQDMKYEQNPDLKSKLIATKGNLYEATLDMFFGCGLLLSQKDKFGTVEQKGANRLGLKLIDLRGKYISEQS